jgi:hypothetical protein
MGTRCDEKGDVVGLRWACCRRSRKQHMQSNRDARQSKQMQGQRTGARNNSNSNSNSNTAARNTGKASVVTVGTVFILDHRQDRRTSSLYGALVTGRGALWLLEGPTVGVQTDRTERDQSEAQDASCIAEQGGVEEAANAGCAEERSLQKTSGGSAEEVRLFLGCGSQALFPLAVSEAAPVNWRFGMSKHELLMDHGGSSLPSHVLPVSPVPAARPVCCLFCSTTVTVAVAVVAAAAAATTATTTRQQSYSAVHPGPLRVELSSGTCKMAPE